MGLIRKIEKDDLYSLGIWRIEEDYQKLFSMVNLNNSDCEVLSGFQNPARKLEWLSVRVLLKNLVGGNTGIYYNGNRKPFLTDRSQHISISHSGQLSSVLLSRDHRVGIDLEHMSHRIGKIRHKFINENEYITTNMDLEFYHMYIHWCAKEALYKIGDKTGLNFKTNLLIDPFEPNDKGLISGKIVRQNQNEDFKLNYFKFENYIVVWTIKGV